MTILNLSGTAPDYEDIRAQISAALASKGSWEHILTTQTGQTIIDFIASVGAFANMKGMRYAQDAYSETAVSDRALYAIADMQGLRLPRKIAASMTVQMKYVKNVGTDPDSVTLPAFTQFQGAGTYWYNNQSYVVNNNVVKNIELYQGYIVDQTFKGINEDYQTFVSVEKNFTVSDNDVYVWINNLQITKTLQGLWLSKGVNAVRDVTTPDGRLMLQFGNSAYGAKPLTTDNVRVLYAVTSGYDGNAINISGAKVAQVNNILAGTVTYTILDAAPTGGANEQSAAVYKRVASSNFGSFGAAVTRSQYVAAALEYPGIIDAKTFAQRELDPDDVTLMNTVKVVPITSGTWNTSQKNAFLAAMQDRTMYAVRFYWVNPTAVLRTIKIHLFCFSWANLADCEADAAAAVTALLAPKQGILGYDHSISDLDAAIRASNNGIEYLDVITPDGDMQVSGRPMAAPTVTAYPGGTLPAGTYTYAVYANDGNGNTAPINFSIVSISGGNKVVKVDWAAYPGATQYTVVGRIGGSLGQITTLPAGTLTFIDFGLLDPFGALPTPAQYPVLYNKLSSVTVTSEYSQRRIG